MDRVAVKLEQDLVPMVEGNGEKQVKSLLIMLVHVLHRHWRRWNGMRKAKV